MKPNNDISLWIPGWVINPAIARFGDCYGGLVQAYHYWDAVAASAVETEDGKYSHLYLQMLSAEVRSMADEDLERSHCQFCEGVWQWRERQSDRKREDERRESREKGIYERECQECGIIFVCVAYPAQIPQRCRDCLDKMQTCPDCGGKKHTWAHRCKSCKADREEIMSRF